MGFLLCDSPRPPQPVLKLKRGGLPLCVSLFPNWDTTGFVEITGRPIGDNSSALILDPTTHLKSMYYSSFEIRR